MEACCKKCGSGLKPKGFVYRADKSVRYHRMRCVSCNAVNYVPHEERATMQLEEAKALYYEGRLKVWFENRVWDVK